MSRDRDAEFIRRLYGRYDPARGITADDQARDAAMAHIAELDSQPHVPETIDLPRGVRERQSTRRRVIAPRWGGPRTRVAVAAAAAGVIAAGAAATAVTMRSGAPATGTENSVSARADLLAAIERTGALSYSFSMMTRTTMKSGVHPTGPFTTRGAGEMAPSARKGMETLTSQEGAASGSLRIRWLGPYEYLNRSGAGKLWMRLPSSLTAFPDGVNAISSGTPEPGGANPQNLLGLLASGYDVRAEGSASGNGWTGTRYVFAEKPEASGESAVVLGTPGLGTLRFPAASVTGTVDVDSHGRVREFTEVTSPLPYQKMSYRMEITFGDFGIQVPVSAPPASQTRS